MTEDISEPEDPSRRPGLDDETDGLDCFAAEGASVVDEADDAVVVRIAAPPLWQLSWPGIRVTAVAAVLVVVGLLGMWMSLRAVPPPRAVVVPTSVRSSPAPPRTAVVPRETAAPVTELPRAVAIAAPPAAVAPRPVAVAPVPPVTVGPASPAPLETTTLAIPVASPIVIATPEVVTPPLAPEAAAARAAIVTPPSDRTSIERLLQQYRDAYDRLDAPSAALIWPRVDTRALNRAFSTLAEQDLLFDSCDLDIADTSANARCQGEIRYVRRVGDQVPRVRKMSWSFALERVSDRWQIAQVTAD